MTDRMDTRREWEEAVRPYLTSATEDADIESQAAQACYRYLVSQYRPPAGKRGLVFLQCSVRRPFSKSPSHGALRRAIALATGYDPRRQFGPCPVHVVVVSSTLGPVPYELEDLYPASIGRLGVKQFSDDRYAQVRPVLAERVAGYLRAHGGHYQHIVSFTHGRYGEILADARRAAEASFPILPVEGGPAVPRRGDQPPRTYWQRHWIQLYLEIVSWLPAEEQARAEVRLQQAEVHYRGSADRS